VPILHGGAAERVALAEEGVTLGSRDHIPRGRSRPTSGLLEEVYLAQVAPEHAIVTNCYRLAIVVPAAVPCTEHQCLY